jgi:hypothetical protein
MGRREAKMRKNSEEKTGKRGGRLKGVRKRKRARRGFECEVLALKMRLVEANSRRREE